MTTLSGVQRGTGHTDLCLQFGNYNRDCSPRVATKTNVTNKETKCQTTYFPHFIRKASQFLIHVYENCSALLSPLHQQSFSKYRTNYASNLILLKCQTIST
jgi:hypothetical protein